jgi:hypothetical protein
MSQMPVVRCLVAGGQKAVQHDEGIGDLTLALPLKKYFNLDARSGSWTLAPQLRIPLGKEDDEFEVWDGVWGSGLSLGYETETYHWFIATSAGFWIFEQPEPAEWSYSLDLGWNARDDMQILWESDLSWDDENKFFLSAGPALYWRWNDKIHIRIEWKHDFVSRVSLGSGLTMEMATASARGSASFSKPLDEAGKHPHHHGRSPTGGWPLLFLA